MTRMPDQGVCRWSRKLACLLAVVWGTWPDRAATAADPQEIQRLFRSGKYIECVEAAASAIRENEYNEQFRLLKLRAELELGRYADAAQTLDLALTKFPYSVQLRWLGRDVRRYNGQLEAAQKIEAEIAQLFQQAPWRYSDSANQLIAASYVLTQGTDPRRVLDAIYNPIKKRQPSYAEVFLASGELALDKHDYALAGQDYQQAVKLDEKDARAHFGVARAFAPSDGEKAEAAIRAALQCNPNHLPSLLFVADRHIDAERYDSAAQALRKVEEINPQQPQALAYRAVLAHLNNQPESENHHRAAALKHWPANPLVDHLIGLKLSQKYRFAEGAQYQRRALEFDPNYLPAKMQLAQDLLRLGQEEEGLKLAEAVYQADGYNIFAHNLVTLQENLTRFRTLEEDGFVIRMEAREAEIYGGRVVDLLRRAKQVLNAKYEVTIDQPVIVELFPQQQDFAIRTFGLPGGAGFLGVCFGTVITANSPASQGTSPSCWESTLWHEYCHVVTLNKTHNKMPRWLSEGISVYEERQANPAWGERLNPAYREMMLGDDLTPVSRLSGAFLSPKSALHLQFAYYESSLVVEYLIERYGLETLQRVLTDLGAGMPINESLARYTGALELLDQEFAEFARARAQALAPQADWTTPELPRQADLEAIRTWLRDRPHNYPGLKRLAAYWMAQKNWEEARRVLEKLRELYPDDVAADSPNRMLARLYQELGQNQDERAVLEGLVRLSDDDVDAVARLAELALAAEDWEGAREFGRRWLAINPLVPAPHRITALAGEHLEDHDLTIGSYQALLLLDPFDPAEIHLKLATEFEKIGKLPDAKRHAILCLAETPRYRAAHQRLLSITDKMKVRESQ